MSVDVFLNFVLPILLFLLIYFFIAIIKNKKSSGALSDLYTNEDEHQRAIDEIPDFDSEYFERAGKGEKTQEFLKLGAPELCSMLQSLLFAEGIPSYIENIHINTIYPVHNLGSSSAFSIKLYILVSDYDKAYEIISDFVSNSQEITILPKLAE